MAAGFTPAATERRYSSANRRLEKTFRKSEQREREQPRAKRQAMRGNRQVPSYDRTSQWRPGLPRPRLSVAIRLPIVAWRKHFENPNSGKESSLARSARR